MTRQELNAYIKLKSRLVQCEEMHESLMDAASTTTTTLTGMPRKPGYGDKIGNYAPSLADLSERIRFLKEEIGRQTKDILTFIKTVDDERVRVFIRLYYLEGLSWPDIGDAVGDVSGGEKSRKICDAYFRGR